MLRLVVLLLTLVSAAYAEGEPPPWQPTPTKTPIPLTGPPAGSIQCAGHSTSNSYNDPLEPPYILPPDPVMAGKMCAAASIRSYYRSNADMAFSCGMCCRYSMLRSLFRAPGRNPDDPIDLEGPKGACISQCMTCTESKTLGYWPNRWNVRCLTEACRTNIPGINQCFKVDQDAACPAASGPLSGPFPVAVPITDAVVVRVPQRNPGRPVPPWQPPPPPPEQGVCCYSNLSHRGSCQRQCGFGYTQSGTCTMGAPNACPTGFGVTE